MSESVTLVWSKPITPSGNARRWHIFDEDGRALCGNWQLLGSGGEEVAEDDTYTEDQDCKECCRKADLEGIE